MKKMLKMSFVLLLAMSFVLAGCGNNNNAASNGNTSGAGNEKKSDAKVGMVTDVGGVNDKSFNQSAWEGLQEVKSETGAEVQYLQSKSNADYNSNLNKFVKGGFTLTWGIGFELGDAIKTVADQNPEAHIGIIDAVVDAPNVKSVTFSEHEGSFLVGVIAGSMTKSNKIGFVGGMEIPVIKRFEAGFVAGVAAVNPDAKVIPYYTGAFDKPDLGKTAAATMYNDGADIIFQAAGATGTGVFNEGIARKKQGQEVWVIGVDKDQSLEFGDEITLTSMIKKVDEAVKTVSLDAINGKFEGGQVELGLKDNGVDVAETSSKNVPEDILKKVEEYKQQIINGEITVPQE